MTGDPATPADPVILGAPFDPSLDIDGVTNETRTVAEALRETFGACPTGLTDLHLIQRFQELEDERGEGLKCGKCGTVFIKFVRGDVGADS